VAVSFAPHSPPRASVSIRSSGGQRANRYSSHQEKISSSNRFTHRGSRPSGKRMTGQCSKWTGIRSQSSSSVPVRTASTRSGTALAAISSLANHMRTALLAYSGVLMVSSLRWARSMCSRFATRQVYVKQQYLSRPSCFAFLTHPSSSSSQWSYNHKATETGSVFNVCWT
jgi:hypothetical protein